MLKIIWGKIRSAVFILIGNIMYALSLNLFLVGNNITAGGFTGIAIMLNHFFTVPVGITVFVLNIPLLFLSWRFKGVAYTLRCLVSITVFSVITDLLSFLPLITTNKLLAALAGGAFYGIGVGMMVFAGAAAGGTDLLSRLLLLVFKDQSVGRLLMYLDGIIVVASIFVFGNIEVALYATVAIIVYSKTSDGFLSGFKYAKICYIITAKPEEIAKGIMQRLPRGVTRIHAVGMFTNTDRPMLMAVVKRREAFKLKDVVSNIDPLAFVIVSEAQEVLGEGFQNNYEKKPANTVVKDRS